MTQPGDKPTNSRNEHLPDPQQRHYRAIFRTSIAVGIVPALLAAAALLPKAPAPGAAIGSEFNDVTTSEATSRRQRAYRHTCASPPARKTSTRTTLLISHRRTESRRLQ